MGRDRRPETQRKRRERRRAGFLFLTLTLFAQVTGAAGAAAAAKPDLIVKRLSLSVHLIERGTSATVRETVKNRGESQAGWSKVRYYLSKDKTKSSKDAKLDASRRVGRLAAGTGSRGKTSIRVPGSFPIGKYFLIACADASHRVSESREGNNCTTLVGSVQVTPTSTYSFPADADPRSVIPVIDAGQAVTKAIGSEGGSVELNANDGTNFTLTIPPDALLSPEEITMTPVTSIGGLPFAGGLVAAVKLEPEGLIFLHPATLTIDPSTSVTPQEETSFGYFGAGEDFHLHHLVEDISSITFSLSHFSSYGVASGTDAERQAQLGRMPQRTEAQYQQLAHDLLAKERRAQLLGEPEDPDLSKKLADLLRGYYMDVVRPAMQAAATDDSKASSAIAKFLSWARDLELLGLSDEMQAEIDEGWNLFWAIIVNAYNKAYQRCVDDHDPNEALTLLSITRTAELLGGGDLLDSQKFLNCLTFKLDFDGTLDNYGALGAHTTSHIKLTGLRIVPDFSGFCLPETETTCTKDFEYVSFTAGDWQGNTICGSSLTGYQEPMSVAEFSFALNLKTEPATVDPNLEIGVAPGFAEETVSFAGEGGSCSPVTWGWYQATFFDLYAEQMNPDAGTFALTDWTYPGGAVWATKTIQRTVPNPSGGDTYATETSTWQLRHTPGA